MKLCCSSRSYARLLQSNGLTQLEWIDRCAELALDGIEFAASHFPRTDSDYLAQLKKLCVDRGLTSASVSLDVPFGEGDVDAQITELEVWIDRALSLGTPLLRFACGAASGSPGIAWRELIRALKHASVTAKDRNVTLAIEAREASLVAAPADLKRAIKECDSAWLRWAPSLGLLQSAAAAEWETLLDEAVIAVCAGDETAALAALLRNGFIGFTSIESAGDSEDAALAAAVRRLRAASA
jgi:sugar phosphate isomerase/epimerase